MMGNKPPPPLAILIAMVVCRCSTKQSPNASCPELYQKPLDTAIGQLLALYCSSSCQGNRQTNNDEKTPALLAVLMAMAMCRYVTMCIA